MHPFIDIVNFLGENIHEDENDYCCCAHCPDIVTYRKLHHTGIVTGIDIDHIPGRRKDLVGIFSWYLQATVSLVSGCWDIAEIQISIQRSSSMLLTRLLLNPRGRLAVLSASMRCTTLGRIYFYYTQGQSVKTSQHWALFAQGSHPREGWRDSTIPCRKLLPHLGKPTWLPWPPCPVVPKPASGAWISKYKIWSSRLLWGIMWWMVLSISACPSEPVIPQKSGSAIFLN